MLLLPGPGAYKTATAIRGSKPIILSLAFVAGLSHFVEPMFFFFCAYLFFFFTCDIIFVLICFVVFKGFKVLGFFLANPISLCCVFLGLAKI